MPNTTRRVRAGTEPPPDMLVQFAEPGDDPTPPGDVNVTTMELIGATCFVCLLLAIGFFVGRASA